MAQGQNDLLTSNPFETYRDPKTGRWVVIRVEKSQETPETAKKDASGDGPKRYSLTAAVA